MRSFGRTVSFFMRLELAGGHHRHQQPLKGQALRLEILEAQGLPEPRQDVDVEGPFGGDVLQAVVVGVVDEVTASARRRSPATSKHWIRSSGWPG